MKKVIVLLAAMIFSTATYAVDFTAQGLTITHAGVKANEYSYFKVEEDIGCPNSNRVNNDARSKTDPNKQSFTYEATANQLWNMFTNKTPIEFLSFTEMTYAEAVARGDAELAGSCWVKNIRAASYDSDYTLLDYQVNGGFKCEGPIISGMKYHYESYDAGIWVPGGSGTMTNCQSNAAAQLLYPTRWFIEINGWKSQPVHIMR